MGHETISRAENRARLKVCQLCQQRQWCQRCQRLIALGVLLPVVWKIVYGLRGQFGVGGTTS